jgi:hypothetical protein
MRLPINLLCMTLSILPSTLAVFAEDAYHVDYHHQLLGIPQPHTTFFHRPRPHEKATLLYTLSDLGVLGAVNPGTGEVVWRQLLAASDAGDVAGPAGFLRPIEGQSSVVSAIENRVDAWDAMSGKASWGNVFEGTVRDLEVVEIPATDGQAKDVLALFEANDRGVLRRLNGDNGDVVWEHKGESHDAPLQVSAVAGNIFLVSLHSSGAGYDMRVTTLDPKTGKKTNDYKLSSHVDVSSPGDVLFVGANSAAPIVAWTDRAKKNLKINLLGKPKDLQTLSLKESDGDILKVTIHAPHLAQSLPHFLVYTESAVSNGAEVYHTDLASGSIKKAYDLPKLAGTGTVSTSSQDANVYFTRITEEEIVLVSSASHGILGRWPVKTEKDHGALLHGVAEVVKRSEDTYAVRSAVVTSDEDWVLVRNGAEAWSRPEGLSGAVAAEWAEIPEAETLAKVLEAEAHSNPLSAYIHRVKRHINDLQYLPAYLQELPLRILGSVFPGEAKPQKSALVRDNFGFNKLAIVATQRGRVYGLDVGNQGSIVWSLKAFDIQPGKKWVVRGIWADKSQDVAAIRGSEGEFITIQTATGAIVQTSAPGSSSPVTTAAVIDSSSGRWFLPIGLDGNPGEIEATRAPKDTLVVQGANSEVRGLKFEAKGETAHPIVAWTFKPALGERIIDLAARPINDPVASIGKVLGDRTVLYKYLNPNTVLVTAVSDETSTASFYLLDTVSGDILYSISHEGVDTSQPITSALTENWFTYSLWSDILNTTTVSSSKGYQIIISEMFESEIPNDRGPLGAAESASSLEPSEIPNAEPAIPHVITQSFLISEPISHMSVTETRQGITTRELLCSLASSNSIVGIPRALLDPRRPVGRDPTPKEQEEGLFRYSPVIELDPKFIITHNREVIGVKEIITTPALLESTSLVFAYGIDVFGTRVTPSAAFDILGKGFNKLSLLGTVVALAIGVFVLAPMVRSSCESLPTSC